MSSIFGKPSRTCRIAAIALLLLAANPVVAIPFFPAAVDSIALRGTVVSSVDGTPIRAALVQLLGEKPRAMLTGTDGNFAFEGLQAGDAVIVARKPGYFSAQEYFPESVGKQRVHLGPNLKEIALKLYPEAVVYGRVTNEKGRPLEGFTVMLQRMGASASAASRAAMSAITNENGEYRLAELRAGTYVVSASQRLNADVPIALFRTSNLRSGYPTYFYPGVPDLSAATQVRLTAGKQFQADVRMTSGPLYRVSGSVQGAGGGAPIMVVLVGRQDIWPVAAAAVMPGLNGFSLEGVSAGSYLLGGAQSTAEGGSKTGMRDVEVSGNMEGVTLAIGEGRPIQVQFRFQLSQPAGNSAELSGMYVDLLRADMPLEVDLSVLQLGPRPDHPAGFEVQLQPGKYRARLNAQPKGCVVSVKSGTKDILSEDLLVAAGGSAETIEVVVRDDCGTVKGAVSQDGQPAVARVFLIPEDAPRRGISTAADSDGAFQFEGLVPGKYYAVAVDGADDLDPSDPETLVKLESQATLVEVLGSGSASITLELKSLEP
jgi:hypothetical protein